MTTAADQIASNKIRSFFTLLGIMVSVAFLVAVVAIIQGMNAYVTENVAGAVIGANSFQVRRTPLTVGPFDDEAWRRVQRRPSVDRRDEAAVRAALPEAEAIALTSGFPTPVTDVVWRNQSLGGIAVTGVTPEYQIVQDYRFDSGRPISSLDLEQRRAVAVIGHDVADKLFPSVDPVGQDVRLGGEHFEVIGVVAAKGSVLGQSFDTFALIPYTRFEMLYGRRQTVTISVKMRDPETITPAMARVVEALRVTRRLRPGQENTFSVETAEALVAFWKNLTRVLFSVVPAMVGIGIVVGGIVIMNIMLMAVTERTREIGIRKAVGARARDIERQFLAEAVMLSALGGALGIVAGWAVAGLVDAVSPLPARITGWSVAVALLLGVSIGVIFGVYPSRRAARLDPITAMRAE
ncbi:MAG: ABC transporter permease [Gemmatimonadetes bacterium]|nr:ABC transporter permease [Gemmatimonadota bacterium]